MAKADLKFELLVDDKGTVKIKRFGKTVDEVGTTGVRFGKNMQAAASGVADLTAKAVKAVAKIGALALALGSLAVGLTLKAAVREFADFEVALAKMGNVTKIPFEELKKQIRGLPAELGTSTELMKGYYMVMSAGVTDTTKALDLLQVSAKASKETGVEQGEIVKGLAAAMSAYGEELKTSADAADLLYQMEAKGLLTVQELIPYIGNLANMSKAVGLSANEMGAALAQVSTAGQGTSIAVTQLQSLLSALSRNFDLLPESIKQYGSALEAVKQLGFDGVLKEIWEATEGNSTSLIKMLGNQEAYMALLQLSKGEFGEYAIKMQEMTEKTGAFDDSWARYSETLKAVWDTFKNVIGNQLVLLGEKLAPKIKEVVEAVGEWLEKMQDPITEEFSRWVDLISKKMREMVPYLQNLATRAKEWYQANKDLIAVKVEEYLKKLGDAMAFVAENVPEMVQGLKAVLSVLGTIAKSVLWLGEKLGWLAAKFVSLFDQIDRDLELNVEFTGEGSDKKPLSEKTDEMIGKIGEFEDAAGGTTENLIEFKADAGAGIVPAMEGIDMVSEGIWELRQRIQEAMLLSVDTTGAISAIENVAAHYTKVISIAEQEMANANIAYMKALTNMDVFSSERWYANAYLKGANIVRDSWGSLKGEKTKAMSQFSFDQKRSNQKAFDQSRTVNNYVNVQLSPTYMTGDRTAANRVADDLIPVFEERMARYG